MLRQTSRPNKANFIERLRSSGRRSPWKARFRSLDCGPPWAGIPSCGRCTSANRSPHRPRCSCRMVRRTAVLRIAEPRFASVETLPAPNGAQPPVPRVVVEHGVGLWLPKGNRDVVAARIAHLSYRALYCREILYKTEPIAGSQFRKNLRCRVIVCRMTSQEVRSSEIDTSQAKMLRYIIFYVRYVGSIVLRRVVELDTGKVRIERSVAANTLGFGKTGF